MSEVLVQLGTKGSEAVLGLTGRVLEKAIKEKGAGCAVGFPETNYFLPFINALLKIEVKSLGGCLEVLELAKKLNNNEAIAQGLKIDALGGILNKGLSTLICEEILAALSYLNKEHPNAGGAGFLPDTLLRSLGLQLVDGRIAGIAVILGPAKDEEAAVQLVRDFQKRSIVSILAGNIEGNTFKKQLENKKVELGLENYIAALGDDYLSAIYAVNFAIRAPLMYGGYKSGQWHEILSYAQKKVPAFVVLLSHVDEVLVATGLGALALGFPIITDLEVPQLGKIDTTLYEALVTEKDYQKLAAKCIETRGLKVKITDISIPVSYAAAFEGERVRKEQLYVEFGGKSSLSFEYLITKNSAEVEDAKIELIGPDIDRLEKGSKSLPLAIIVEVAGRKMQKDFEPILERQIHRFINYAMGLMHIGQRDMNWIRISQDAFSKGFRLKHIGIILHAMLHQEYSAIVDKVQVKIYTKKEDVDKLLSIAKKVFDQRDERLSGMSDESVDTFYSCLLCQSFAPNHVCIITPERLGLCGAYSWLDGKASFEITPTGPNQPIKKEEVSDAKLGQWRNVNEFVYNKSNKTIEKVSMYSLMDSPQSSCVIDDTQVIIDNEIVPVGSFIDKHRGGQDYTKSQALTLKKGKSSPERIVAMQRFDLSDDKRNLIKITTKSGAEIVLTGNHEIAVDRPEGFSWIPASKIRKQDRIISLKRLDIKEATPKVHDIMPLDFLLKNKKGIDRLKSAFLEDEDLFYLMGLIASDGSVFRRGNYEYNIYFINTKKELIDKYEKLYRRFFPQNNLHISRKPPSRNSFIKGRQIRSVRDCYVCYSNNSIFGLMLDFFGITPQKGKRYLKNMLNLPKGSIAKFLTGLFDGDGSVRLRKYGDKWHVAEAYLCCKTKRQAIYLQFLLKRFGILSNLRKSNSVYKVEMHGSNVYEFSKITTPIHKEKQALIRKIRLLYRKKIMDKTQNQVLPFFIGKMLTQLPESKTILSPATQFYYKTFRSRPVWGNVWKVIKDLDSTQAKILKSFLKGDFYLDIVKKAEENKVNKKYVYNLTLSDTHCYFANQMLIKNCGCFECIVAIIPEVNGVMIVHRDYSGITPCGMSFTTLAGSVGGGVQTPGFLGVGKLYIASKKFISAEGGLKRLVWMPRELKELLADKLKARAKEIGEPDFMDKIADETVAVNAEELLKFLEKVNHPALGMQPLV